MDLKIASRKPTTINLLKLPFVLTHIAPLSLLYISLADQKRMGVLADVLRDRPVLASSTWSSVGHEDYRANDGKFGYDFGTSTDQGGWH